MHHGRLSMEPLLQHLRKLGFGGVAIVTVALSVGFPKAVFAQGSVAAQRVRAAYFVPDFEGGVIEGAAALQRAPLDHQLRAWYILNLVGNSQTAQAVAAAREMVAGNPTEKWAL